MNFVDRCVCCKILLVIFGFLLSLVAIGFVGFISLSASSATSQALALSFFISLLFGLGPLNFLRIVVNARHAPAIAMEVEDEEGDGG